MTSLVSSLEDILIGNDAGWLLSFSREGSSAEPLEISRDDYYAEIEATLPSGIDGGKYTITIEGITDEHYGKLAQGKTTSPDTLKLYLYWRDTNASVTGYLKNLGGLTDSFSRVTSAELGNHLVAVLAVSSVSRKAGSRRYEAKIEAREKVFGKLSRERLCAALDAADPLEAARMLAEDHGVETEIHPLPKGSSQPERGENPGDPRQELRQGRTIAETMKDLGSRMEQSSGQHYGRGMFLIRDGVLNIGARPIPLSGSEKDLSLRTGLIETESLAPVVLDRNFDYCQSEPDGTRSKPRRRRQFKLTLKGRPDLKPGDVVRFDLPQPDVETTLPDWTGVIGDLFRGPLVPSLDDSQFEHPVLLYVASTTHKLGRSSGFVTTVTGVQIENLEDAWDAHTRRHNENDECCEACSDGTIEGRVANAVDRHVQSAIRSKAFPEVGEVRQVNSTGSEEPPSQTLTVWRGLAPADGRRNQARRLAIQRPSPEPASGVAYVTPFAWGKCGLVLPRYPGTRVLVTHRHGHYDDPIDIGALWESGHGPDAEAGDYWLTLPVGVDETKRETLPSDATPQEHTGKVTNDLIDAEGERVIEVGSLTIRIGSNALQDAGTRPAPGADAGLDGTQIVIGSDGSVLIKTKGKNIELDAGDGDINLNAKKVNVTVQDKMDVS